MRCENLYLTGKGVIMNYNIYQRTILENPYVISKIREFLSADYEQGMFDDTFNEIQGLIELVRSEGLLALEKYKDNSIIQEFIMLILSGLFDKNTPTPTECAVEHAAFITIPRIIYSDLTPIEFIKTVLLYETVLMIFMGSFSDIINRLNSVIKK
jgi:hypothetical protein